MNRQMRSELQTALAAEHPLPALLDQLRAYKDRGASREEVQAILESLRADARDDATEDRILELLDFVTGFCALEKSIWAESLDR